MRNLLVHLEATSTLDSLLACAHLVARRFSSYVEGFYVGLGPSDIIAAGADGFVAAAPELVASIEREAKERAERVRERFVRFWESVGLSVDGEGEGVRVRWREDPAAGAGLLGSVGRCFDLILVGRPGGGASMAALESALFEAGRPILVAPPTPPESLGRHVVVAWNGSTESARTVALAMPFLARAERVTVLTVREGMVPGPDGAELAASLARHGLPVERHEVSRGEASVGETILARCTAVGGDLLVKGAYTQSRLRQMIFGGATSHILHHTEVPVVMAN